MVAGGAHHRVRQLCTFDMKWALGRAAGKPAASAGRPGVMKLADTKGVTMASMACNDHTGQAFVCAATGRQMLLFQWNERSGSGGALPRSGHFRY